MTEVEWLRCRAPYVMLSELRSRPGPRLRRWVLFNIACGRLVWELLDDTYRSYLHRFEEWAEREPPRGELPVAWESELPVRWADSFPTEMGFADREARMYASRVVSRLDSLNNSVPDAAQLALTRIVPKGGRAAARFAIAQKQAHLLRDIFGNPFRPVAFDPSWRTSTVVALARQVYESRDFGAMPILADALQDASCENSDILGHCRDPNGTHVRGCWVVDLVLGKS